MVALVVGGCAVDENKTSSAQLVVPCDNPLVCPGNSDLLGVLGPYELDETGFETSARGWRITVMALNGQTVTDLTVTGTSVHATQNGVSLTGSNLIGLKLTLQHTSGQVVNFEIKGGPTRVPYYVGGLPADFEGFQVTYDTGVGSEEHELCPYSASVDASVTGDWAVFWKGDRFDPDTGRIFASDAGVGRWFNISCAGEAPIKMLRARTGGAVAPGSPVDQRQATLNMFTASYCGPTGKRYTQLGVPLTWSDLSGPSQIGAVSSYEAVWSANGAVCLTKPRIVLRTDIYCAIPTCTDPAAWQSSGWLLSGNPPLPPP